MSIEIKNKTYLLTVEEIQTNEIILKLENSKTEFSIKTDRKNKLNLDGEKGNELMIEILNIEESSAEIKVTTIETFIRRGFHNINRAKELFIQLIGAIAIGALGFVIYRGAF